MQSNHLHVKFVVYFLCTLHFGVVETSIIVYLMPGHFQSGSQMSNLNTLIQMHDMMTDSNEVADFRT